MTDQEKEKEKRLEDIAKEAEAIKCPVKRVLYFVDEFLSGPMCGKCFPCSMGSFEARLRLVKITSGKGTKEDISALRGIAGKMLPTSRCKKGKDTANYIIEAIGEKDFLAHIDGVCPEKECGAFIEYRIEAEKCVMCGLCSDACGYNAILGEKKKAMLRGYLPFEIRQHRCVKCGDCVGVCPTGAIMKVDVKEPEEELVNI